MTDFALNSDRALLGEIQTAMLVGQGTEKKATLACGLTKTLYRNCKFTVYEFLYDVTTRQHA
jgi:hypothetical protein